MMTFEMIQGELDRLGIKPGTFILTHEAFEDPALAKLLVDLEAHSLLTLLETMRRDYYDAYYALRNLAEGLNLTVPLEVPVPDGFSPVLRVANTTEDD